MNKKLKELNEELLELEARLEALKVEGRQIPTTLTGEDGKEIENPDYEAAQLAIQKQRSVIDAKQLEIANVEQLFEVSEYFNVENKEHPLGQIIDFLAHNKIDAREFLHTNEARINVILEGKAKPSFMGQYLLKKKLGIKYKDISEETPLLSLNPKLTKRIEKVRYLDKYLRLEHNGLTLARAVSLSETKWVHYESGFTIPSTSTMRNIANYFMLPDNMLLDDGIDLPPYDQLKIDEDLASIQRKDLSEMQNRVRNKGYIRRNYKVLGHKDRVRMISSLLLILVPLGIYTGFCTSRVLSSRNESLASMSRDGSAILRDDLAAADPITKSVYSDYSAAVNKDGAAIVKVGADVTKIADIEPSNEFFTSNMSLWFDFDQVAFHDMYSQHKGKSSAWHARKPVRKSAEDPSIMTMLETTANLPKDRSHGASVNAVLINDQQYVNPALYEIDWISSNNEVFVVSPIYDSLSGMYLNAEVHPTGIGNATLTAQLRGVADGHLYCEASCSYTVSEIMSFASDSLDVRAGEELVITANCHPKFDISGDTYSIDWSLSQNETCATLSSNPKEATATVTGLKVGNVTVKAQLTGGESTIGEPAELTINVLPANPIKFPELTIDVNLNKSTTLNLTIDAEYSQASYSVVWSSSRPDIATVDGIWNSATLTGIGIGETVITAELIKLDDGSLAGRASIRCSVRPGTATNPMALYPDDSNKNYMDDFTVDPSTGEVAWGSDGNLDYIQLNHPRQLHNYVAQYVNDIGEGEASSYATRNKAIRAASIEEYDSINDIWVAERKAYPGLYGSNVYSEYLRNFEIGKGIEYDSLSYLADPGIHYYLTTDATDTDPSQRTFRVFQHLTFRVKVFKAYDNPRYPLETAQFWMNVTPAEWMSVDKVIYDLSGTIDLSKNQLAGTSGYAKCSADDGVFKNLSTKPEFTNGFRRLKSPYKSSVDLIEYNVDKDNPNLSHSKLTIVCRANRDAFTAQSFLPMSFCTSYINLFAVIVWIIIAFYNQSHNGEDSLGMLGTGMFSAISATIVGLQMVSDASMFSLMTMINIFTLVVILIMTWQAVMAKRAAARKDKTLIAYNGVKLRIMFYALVVATAIVFVGLPLMSYMFMF